MVTDLLDLLYKDAVLHVAIAATLQVPQEQVLDRPSLVRGYATLVCTWQDCGSSTMSLAIRF